MFGAKGFHDTTLKEIAELAEFSVGSVYSFFENKDDLFLNVFLRRGEEFMPGHGGGGRGGRRPPAQLHALVDYEVGFFRDHPTSVGSTSARPSTLPGVELPPSPTLADNFERAMDVQAGIFARGQSSGGLTGR